MAFVANAASNRPWGLRVPGRPETPSEGAAQQYARVGRKEEQRLFSFENGTCLEFGPNDPIDEFDLDHHPFCNQVALVDKAIRDVKAVRDRYSARLTRVINGSVKEVDSHVNGGQQLNGGHEANGDINGYIVSDDGEISTADIEAFDEFRSRRPDPNQLSEVVLESGTYLQVPSRFATLHNMVSVYTTTNKSDMPGEAHPGWNPDTRFGTNGRPPFETVPRQQRRQAERSFVIEQEPILESPQVRGRGRGRNGGANRARDSGNRRQQHGPNQNSSHHNPFSNIDPEVLANAQAAQIQQLRRNAQRAPQLQQAQHRQVLNNSAQQLPLQFIAHAQLMASQFDPDGFVDFGYLKNQLFADEASMDYARFLDDQNNASRAQGDNCLRGDMMNGSALRLQLIPPSPRPTNMQSARFDEEDMRVMNSIRQPLRPVPIERFGRVQNEAGYGAPMNQQSIAQPRVSNSPLSRPAFLSRGYTLPLGFPPGFRSAFSSSSRQSSASLNSPPEAPRPLDLGSVDQRLRRPSSHVPLALQPSPLDSERSSSANLMMSDPTGTESAGHLLQQPRPNLGFLSQVVSRDASPGAIQRRWNGRGGRRLFESAENSTGTTPPNAPSTPRNLAVGSNRPQPRLSAIDFSSQPSR
ncbi:hypothetical protein BGZ60DRAFT_524318 [Tricladium varicosporioides]|nr:hypothetical protein BGZ60DRAFT_524318 [Hymenoscyphus varicosporioides]